MFYPKGYDGYTTESDVAGSTTQSEYPLNEGIGKISNYLNLKVGESEYSKKYQNYFEIYL